ncbi:MAG: hypothetical protein ACYTHK_08585 [Planctomycetota bacterium]|jgi:hypothetical protein
MRHLAFLLALSCVGCIKSDESTGLSQLEVELLSEDVHDLVAILFATGENAWYGDEVSPGEIIEDAQAGNGWTVVYDLPPDFRLGLGPGLGRVRLSIIEDGAVVQDPLSFSFAASDAVDVIMRYEITYEGETLGGRVTDVAFDASVRASRVTNLDPFFVEYWIQGDCYLGATLCRMSIRFNAVGPPRALVAGIADGAGLIDDPDVRDELDLDLDFPGNGTYIAEGWVGCCSWFRERFNVPG